MTLCPKHALAGCLVALAAMSATPAATADVIAVRIDVRGPLHDPEADFWQMLPATTVAMFPQNIAVPHHLTPAVDEITVRVAHNGAWIGVMIEWHDDTADWIFTTDSYGDQVAVQFPITLDPLPAPMMGDAESAVNILQWRAAFQRDLEEGDIDILGSLSGRAGRCVSRPGDGRRRYLGLCRGHRRRQPGGASRYQPGARHGRQGLRLDHRQGHAARRRPWGVAGRHLAGGHHPARPVRCTPRPMAVPGCFRALPRNWPTSVVSTQAFGIDVREDAPERPDHLSVELEFYATLLAKEAYACFNGWSEREAVTRDAARDFLNDHLGRWQGVLTERLERHDALTPFPEAARWLDRFLKQECHIRDVAPQPYGGRWRITCRRIA
jgi:hypothetical protein